METERTDQHNFTAPLEINGFETEAEFVANLAVNSSSAIMESEGRDCNKDTILDIPPKNQFDGYSRAEGNLSKNKFDGSVGEDESKKTEEIEEGNDDDADDNDADDINWNGFEEDNDDDADDMDTDDIYLNGFIIIIGLISACILGLLMASLTADTLKNSMILDFELWKWFVLLLFVIGGTLIAYGLICVINLVILKLWQLEKVMVAYYLHGIKKSVCFLIWLILVFLVWVFLFNNGHMQSKKTRKIINEVTRVLGGFLIGGAIWVSKTLFVKLIASFHINKFFKKIKLVKYNHQALKQISKMPKDAETKKKLSVLRVSHIIRQLQPCYNDGQQEIKYIKNVSGAKKAANEIFQKIGEPETGSKAKYVKLDTLLKLITDDNKHVQNHFRSSAHREVEDNKTMVKRVDFRNWVVQSCKDYNAMRSTLKYRRTAVDELNKLVSLGVLVLIFIVWLLFMEFITTKLLLFFSSQLLLVAFMFGNTAKTVFEAIIFVFVEHPFDIGDRCVIDNVEMIVHEMEILTTTFLRFDGEKIYYPNSVLATKPIANLYRSPNMMDSVEFIMDVAALSWDFKKKLQKEVRSYLKKNKRYWSGEHNIRFKEIEAKEKEEEKIKVILYFHHTISFQYTYQRSKRRSKLLLELREILKRLGIDNARFTPPEFK